jgi:hypothetical protein
VCVVSWISKTVKIRAKKSIIGLQTVLSGCPTKKTFAFLIFISYDYMNDLCTEKLLHFYVDLQKKKMYGKTRGTYHKDEDASPDRCFLVIL